VNHERVRQTLLLLSAVAAGLCIVELLWLRTATIAFTRPVVALLFLPWLAAAAANLGVWYFTLARGKPTLIGRIGIVLFWVVSAGFAIAFAALYGWLLLGTPRTFA
jgi:hypothetical protein